MHIARRRLVRAAHDADDRLRQVLVRQPHRTHVGARRRPGRTCPVHCVARSCAVGCDHISRYQKSPAQPGTGLTSRGTTLVPPAEAENTRVAVTGLPGPTYCSCRSSQTCPFRPVGSGASSRPCLPAFTLPARLEATSTTPHRSLSAVWDCTRILCGKPKASQLPTKRSAHTYSADSPTAPPCGGG